MLGLWNRISRLGVTPGLSPSEAKHIVLSNQVAVLVVVLDGFALLDPVMHKAPLSAGLLALTVAVHPLALVLNAAHRHFAARIFQATWSLSTAVAGCLLLPAASDSRLILMMIAAGVWLVAMPREWKWAGVFSALSLAAYVAIELRASLGTEPVMDPAVVAAFSRLNRFAVFLLMVGVGLRAFVNAGEADTMLQVEREKSRALLLNVLPTAIADRLLEKHGTIADRFDDATVLFADLANFTQLAERTAAHELVATLDAIFSAFDALADRHGLEKIKTIGDAYMVAGGVPARRDGHVQAVASMALEMLRVLPTLPGGRDLTLRIGMHTGPVVAGVIGTKRFSYDMWGDTVNTASRMESHGVLGRVHCSAAVRDALQHAFDFEARGPIDVKGKGPTETFLLIGPKA